MAEKDYGIFNEVTFIENEDIYTEGVIKSSNIAKRLKKIRKDLPDEKEYDEIKRFIDKNGDEIDKYSAVLEEEPEKVNKAVIRSFAGWILGCLGAMAIPVAGSLAVPVAIFDGIVLVCSFAAMIIQDVRATKDQAAFNNLLKIQATLKKIDSNKIPESYREKIRKIIKAIDNVSIEMMEKEKKI